MSRSGSSERVRTRTRAGVEGLEGRRLLSGTFTVFPVPTPGSVSSVQAIVAGPDGNLWFAEGAANRIGRITTSGVVTEFNVPSPDSNPLQITSGPGGALWFTEANTGKIGRITTDGAIDEFPTGLPGGFAGLATGPDGNLWFTAAGTVGRMTPAGVVDEFPTPSGVFRGVGPIAAGPDGNLWFTEGPDTYFLTPKVGRITTAGVVTEFDSGIYGNAITAGPDGSLWFTSLYGNEVGRITTDGVASSFPGGTSYVAIDAAHHPIGLGGIANGPDGALWFATPTGNAIDRITTDGAVADFPLPAPSFIGPTSIATGPDANLWFTLGLGVQADAGGRPATAAAVGRFEPAGPAATKPPGVTDVEREGFHRQPTRLILRFSEALDAASARDPANYVVVGPGRRAHAIRSVAFDGAQTVTLTMLRPLDRHRRYRLTVVGAAPTGVKSSGGVLLAGDGSSRPGSDFVATIRGARGVGVPALGEGKRLGVAVPLTGPAGFVVR